MVLPVAARRRRRAKAEAAFTREIERLVNEGVTAEELARARNQALADFWRGLATIDGKAQALGDYAVLRGGYRDSSTRRAPTRA